MTVLTLVSDDAITTAPGAVIHVAVTVDDESLPVFRSAEGRRLAGSRDEIGIWSATWATERVGAFPITVTAGDAAPVMVAVTVDDGGPPAPTPGDSFVDDAMTAVLADTGSDFTGELTATVDQLAQTIGETIRPSQYAIGSNDRAQLQAAVDAVVASGYTKSIVLDKVYDLSGDGTPRQTVYLYGNGGAGLTSFTLTYNGQTTGSLSVSASAADVQTALEGLSNIGAGNVEVKRTGTGGTDFNDYANPPYSYGVKFKGARANTTVVLSATPTGGTGTVLVRASAISIDRANRYDTPEIVFWGTSGGGIKKTDSGAVFTSLETNTGHVSFINAKFESVSGSGTTLIEADSLIRVTFGMCRFRNWDHLATQYVPWRWLQSITLDRNTKSVGGTGHFVYAYQTFDCTITGLIEDRLGTNGGLFSNTQASTSVRNIQLRFPFPNVQNCAGVPIRLAPSSNTLFQSVYLEQNGQPTDPQIDLYSLASGGRHSGMSFINCMPQQTAAQKANKVGAILVGNNVGDGEHVNSISNWMDGGIMYQFGSTSGLIYGSGDKVENSGYVVYAGQEDQYVRATQPSVSTGNRPKNARLGTRVFDTTLAKVVTFAAAGTRAQFTFRLTAGATSSGHITLTIQGVDYVVAVTAGDTLTQVRDKIVAQVALFYPTWKPRASSTNIVAFDAIVPQGPVSTSSAFNAGGTGVTSDYFGRDVAGAEPTYTVPPSMLTATATLDFPSISAGGQQELTITVTGAAVGDSVTVAPPAALESGVSVSAFVSAANTVKIRLTNPTAGAIDPASATWRATVVR